VTDPEVEPCAALRVAVPALEVEVVSDQLWWLGANAIGEEVDGDAVLLTAGFDTVSAALAAGTELAAWAPAVEVIADKWWMDAWKQYAVPVEVGQRLLLLPSWCERPVTSRLIVDLDAGRAFGSGSHPSTVLALQAIEELVEPGAIVADVGCGSGVLSIAALLLGAAAAIAVDIDRLALAVTRSNAQRNGVSDRLTVAGTAAGDIDTTVDLVVANIGAATLVTLAPTLAPLAPVLVLSGLLERQAAEVAAAFVGWEVRTSAPLEGWVAVVLRRAAGP